VLARAAEYGMRLTYLDRARYRNKHDPALLAELTEAFGPCYVLPEGGSNALAVAGCAQLAAEFVDQAPDVDVVFCPVGTGGTLAGLGPARRAVGVAVLKGGFLAGEVAELQHAAYSRLVGDWQVVDGFHHGGYARRSAALDAFIADFADRHGLALDWVYVAKMMYAVFVMAADRRIPAGSTVAALITGRCQDPAG
jgi:1-aminocyclopropane-1-carboxylate deaminase